MNRAEFVRMLRNSDTTGTMNSIMMTERVVNQVLDTLQRAIVEHGSLKIQGFGVFEVVDVPARTVKAILEQVGEAVAALPAILAEVSD